MPRYFCHGLTAAAHGELPQVWLKREGRRERGSERGRDRKGGRDGVVLELEGEDACKVVRVMVYP